MKKLWRFFFLIFSILINLFIYNPIFSFDKPLQTADSNALRLAIDNAVNLKDPTEKFLALQSIAEKNVASNISNFMITDLLHTALVATTKETELSKKSDILRKSLLEVLVVLTFKPKMEAPVPSGFPEPTPLGVVEFKKLPIYRMAKVSSSTSNTSFFTLFNHIKKNDIAMTAPVEMTMVEKNGKYAESSMAFLYKETSLGKTGTQDSIQVLDTSESLVVCVGMQGSPNSKAIETATKWLNEKLKSKPGEYEIVGELKVMGYNSPFMPDKLKYYEVMLPIKSIKK